MVMVDIQHFINGSFTDASNGKTFESIEPATGAVFANVARGNQQDIQQAVRAAKKAFPAWAGLSAGKRSQYLHKIADAIESKKEELAQAESRDNGKPISTARAIDIPRAALNFRFFANLIVGYESKSHQMPDAINYTLRQPLGAVACISPWNLPLYLLSWKIAPALATGNTVVAKPSEITPFTAFLLSHILREVKLPAGVLNIVHGLGPEAGQALVEHEDISAISFTGGTATGKKIAATAAPQFKKLSLELGGKNPNIIFDDAPFDPMIETSLRSSFANQGEICLCGSRILIQDGIYDRFKSTFVERTRALKVGDPRDEESFMGAIVSRAHYEKILSYIELAKAEGGTVLTGGNPCPPQGRCSNGFFIEPTIIEGLPQSCRTNQEEIFGPVVTLQRFSTKEEAVEIANDVPYGLSATLWSESLPTVQYVTQRLQAGVIWVNTWLHRDLRTPFGGMKQSGVGREGGYDALNFFTEPKNICIKNYE